jgi:hypothetical protein
LPAAGRRAKAIGVGASVLASDPAVESVWIAGVKLQELLAAGTRYAWVVRMTVLRADPVQVEALYDRKAGYESLEAVRAEGAAQGRIEGEAQGLRKAIVAVLIARGLAVVQELQAALEDVEDSAILRALVSRAATAASVDEVLAALRG